MGGRLETTELGGLGDSETEQAGYYSIPVNIYQTDEIIDRDLFLLYQGQYILFRPKNLIWNKEDGNRLSDFGVKNLFIRCESRHEHHQFLESNLAKILDAPLIEKAAKAQIIYDTSTSILGEIFERPNSSENVKRSVSFVKNSIDYLKDKDNFFYLMKMASANFNEYTHAVQVSAYAITLAQHTGMKTFNELSAIGIGSLLHDVGKVKIDRRILEKPGHLDESERREVQKHPEYGYEILHRQRSVPEMAEMIVLQHHERPDGKGYPYRLGSDMAYSAKIVALVDCFDLITSNRPYQPRMKPLDAIEYMRTEVRDDFDQNLLNEFIKVLGTKN